MSTAWLYERNAAEGWLYELNAAEGKIDILKWQLNGLSDRLRAVGFDRLAEETRQCSQLAAHAEEHIKKGLVAVLKDR